MKRLLFVLPSLETGGSERLFLQLFHALNRRKFAPEICVFQKKGALIAELPGDVPLHDLNKRSRWDFFRMLRDFNRLVRERQPDIICSRIWYSTAVASVSRRVFGYPSVLIAAEDHNHKRDLAPDDPFRWVKRRLMDRIHRDADRVVSCSRGAADEIAESYSIPDSRMRVAYPAVDLTEIEAQTTGVLKSERPLIAGFGRLVPRKGFDDLLRTFQMVRNQVDAELVIIGDGPERSRLESLARELQIDGAVRFTGYLDRPFAEIARAWTFVLPSHWEGFGTVVIEAMACGTTVIATDCPHGPGEIILDGKNGRLIPMGGINAMTGAILQQLQDNQSRERLSRSAQIRAAEFSVDRMTRTFEDIFMEFDSGGANQ